MSIFYLHLMIPRVFQFLAAGLFFCSLLLPAFTVGGEEAIGIAALVYGWVGFGHWFGWSWLANPLFVLTVFLFFHRRKSRRRAAVYTAGAAFLLSLSFLLVPEIPGHKPEPMVGVVERKAGYWLWVYSMAALLIGAILNDRKGASSSRQST